MTTLVIDYRGSNLAFDNGALVVRTPDGAVQRVPLGQLERVLIQADASIGAGVLRQMAAARVPLHVLRGRSRADSAMLWPSAGDALRRLAQRRAFDDPDQSLRLARILVRRRLLGQMRVLDEARGELPRIRYPLSRAHRLVKAQLRKITKADDIDTVRGLEGGATALYFSGYRRLFHAQWEFNARRRRPPTDPVNACLSLGYSLLHAVVLDEVHASGLDAALGVLHRPAYNRASLACDLVEIERHIIEYLVWCQFRTNKYSLRDFDRAGAGVALGKSARGAYFGEVMPVLAQAARRTRRRLRLLVGWLKRRYVRSDEVEDEAGA